MEPDNQPEKITQRRISRRAAIKAGGIAAVGLAFSKPLIETIYPKSAFAQASPKPPTGPLGACVIGSFDQIGVGSQGEGCFELTQAECTAQGGEYQGDNVTCKDVINI